MMTSRKVAVRTGRVHYLCDPESLPGSRGTMPRRPLFLAWTFFSLFMQKRIRPIGDADNLRMARQDSQRCPVSQSAFLANFR
jgi:hypothetical protein